MRIPRLIAPSLILGLALAAAGPVHAQFPRPTGTQTAIEGTVGNQVLQLRYYMPAPIGPNNSDLDVGFLLTENREFIASSALMFDTNVGVVPHLRFEVGPQAYLALLNETQKTDIFAIAIGANIRYEIPAIRFAAFGSAFYSPGVTTFGSAHNLYDFIAGVEFDFTPSLAVLGGYRWLKFTLVNLPDDRISNEAFGGIRWNFQ